MIDSIIKSMNRSEKRYYVLLSEAFKKNPEHLRLFRFIDNSPEWKDEKFKKFESGFSGNEAALKKRYLKNTVMDSMRSFHRHRNISRIIMNYIQDADYYYHKLFFNECLKTLEKAKKLAVKHERFGLHLEIIGWQRRLIGSTLEKYAISLKDLEGEESVIHEKNNSELWCRKMQASVFEFKKKYGFLDRIRSKELLHLIPEKSLIRPEKINSKRTKFYYLWTVSLYYSMLSEHEKSYAFTIQIKPDYADVVDPEDLFYGMLEHLTSCIYTHRYKEVASFISKLEKLMVKEDFKNNIAIIERFYYYKTNYLMISYASLGEEKKLIQHLESFKNPIETSQAKISENMMLVLKTTLSQMMFILDQPNQSKMYIREILSHPKNKVRKDILEIHRLLYPFVLLQLNQFDLLESELNGNLKYYHMHKNIYECEIGITKAFLNFNSSSDYTKLHLAREIVSLFKLKFEKNDNLKNFDDMILYNWSLSVISGKKCLAEFKKNLGESLNNTSK